MQQFSLFGRDDSAIDLSFSTVMRTQLRHGAWFDLGRNWVRGHAALFDQILRTTAWRSESRLMYDRTVAVPRQYAMVPEGTARHPLLERMRTVLSARYGEDFERVSLALYRDGNDSVAWHGDTTARDLPNAVVATVSVGEPRRFFLKPTVGGPSIAISLGWGDLLVMGGTCQRTYRHAIPKVAEADPRIAIMFRPVWRAVGADPPARGVPRGPY